MTLWLWIGAVWGIASLVGYVVMLPLLIITSHDTEAHR